MFSDDPTRIDAVVEETLRLSTPTQGMWRIVTRDTQLGGVPLAAGSRIVIVFSSANRDTAVFDDPDEFDPDRDNLRLSLAFGKGIHFCLGANLSRLEGQVALQELSKRIESFTLAAVERVPLLPQLHAARADLARRRLHAASPDGRR